MYHLQVLYQIGIVGERMVTVGGAIFLAVKLPLKTEFSYEPSHPLAVDCLARSFQLGGEVSVAKSRPGGLHLAYFTRCQLLALLHYIEIYNIIIYIEAI
jgi:hypothetical protein